MDATIRNSWPQVDGGVRYEVDVSPYTVTVDVQHGTRSGFVRGHCPDEARVLRAAFRAVREATEALTPHARAVPHHPLTTGQLAVWLDALARQDGNDLPLYVQAARADAPAEVCLDAHVQRGPGGERVVVLSAQALPHREKGAHLS